MSARVPEHAAQIETGEDIARRVSDRDGRASASRAVDIDRDQIRRALGLALVGADEMPRECLDRVREVLAKIGGPL